MIALILIALAVLAAALWLLLRSVRIAPPALASERTELLVLRDRLLVQLRELEAERADQGIDAGVARDEEGRLSAELAAVLRQLEALPVSSPSVAPARSALRLPVLGAMLVVPLLIGAGLYLAQNAGNLQGFWKVSQSGLEPGRVPPMVFEMVTRLEQRLAEHPDDAAGWSRLARSYTVLQQPDKARQAYARAYALAPDNPEVLSDYAWLIFNGNPQVTTGEVFDLYSRLHRLVPQHPDALWFLGFSAYQQGNARKALTYWEPLLGLLPPTDPGRPHLQQAIASARDRLKK